MNPDPEVTFCPLFSEEFTDRMLLLKFVEWPDTDELYCYRLNAIGAWIEFDPEEGADIPPDDMPLLADVDLEEDE